MDRLKDRLSTLYVLAEFLDQNQQAESSWTPPRGFFLDSFLTKYRRYENYRLNPKLMAETILDNYQDDSWQKFMIPNDKLRDSLNSGVVTNVGKYLLLPIWEQLDVKVLREKDWNVIGRAKVNGKELVWPFGKRPEYTFHVHKGRAAAVAQCEKIQELVWFNKDISPYLTTLVDTRKVSPITFMINAGFLPEICRTFFELRIQEYLPLYQRFFFLATYTERVRWIEEMCRLFLEYLVVQGRERTQLDDTWNRIMRTDYDLLQGLLNSQAQLCSP